MNASRPLECKDTDVVILCGGMGKRLRSVVGDRPKPMADVRGRPFLDIVIAAAAKFGFRRFILCAGYKAEFIEEYYGANKKDGVEIIVVKEKVPLGTAGALKNAETFLKSSVFLVTNGDSLCPLDFFDFVSFYNKKTASFAIALVKDRDAKEFGSVRIDSYGRVKGFEEKADTKEAEFINAGIYLLDKEVFSMIEGGRKTSLEREIFPKMAGGKFYGYITDAELLDIGTPERYAKAIIKIS